MRAFLRRRSRGQTLVEFALVAPILILILLAVFDVGRGVFMYTSITNAAREGARLAIVNQDAALIRQRMVGQSAVAETSDADTSKIEILFFRPDANGNPDTSEPCSAPVDLGCLARVRFATTFRPITPIIRQILFPAGVDLKAETVLPVEFTCPNSALSAAQCGKQP
jgi:hypothetical protein